MKVLSICKEVCLDKIPVVVDSFLGDGADGEVFNIKDQPNKVIKFGIFYQWNVSESCQSFYQNLKKSLDYLIKVSSDAFVKIYEHGLLTSGFRKINFEQEYVIYYYIMEKLQKISNDESKVFHTILSHEDRNIFKNYSINKITEMLQGMALGLDFDIKKIILFCESIRKSFVQHLDIHVRNIMKDNVGYFKLIDVDRIQIGD